MDPHLLKVAVIGAANAGKSTLINKLVGEEVRISRTDQNIKVIDLCDIRFRVFLQKHIQQEKESWRFFQKAIIKSYSWIHLVLFRRITTHK